MKKLIWIAVLVMTIAGLRGMPTHAQAKVTLTYLVSQGWVFDAEQALGKKFEEQTGIAVDYQVIPSDQFFNVLKTKLNSGEGPDIFGGQSGVTDLKLQYNVERKTRSICRRNPGPRRKIRWSPPNRRSTANSTA